MTFCWALKRLEIDIKKCANKFFKDLESVSQICVCARSIYYVHILCVTYECCVRTLYIRNVDRWELIVHASKLVVIVVMAYATDTLHTSKIKRKEEKEKKLYMQFLQASLLISLAIILLRRSILLCLQFSCAHTQITDRMILVYVLDIVRRNIFCNIRKCICSLCRFIQCTHVAGF